MADTTESSLQIVDQETGGNNNNWGDIADANNAKFVTAIAGVTSVAVTGGTVALTDDQNRAAVLVFTGTLASNQIVTVNAAVKNWHIRNATSGSYTLTVKTASGSGGTITQGRSARAYCDGTDVVVTDDRMTVSNTGSSGVGIFKQITASDIELYKLLSQTTALTIALDGTDKIDFTIRSASETVDGIVELATKAETEARSSTSLAATPGSLADFILRTAKQSWDAPQTLGNEVVTYDHDDDSLAPDLSNSEKPWKTIEVTDPNFNVLPAVNCAKGDVFLLELVQDSTGGRVITMDSAYINQPLSFPTTAEETILIYCFVYAVSGTTATTIICSTYYQGAV